MTAKYKRSVKRLRDGWAGCVADGDRWFQKGGWAGCVADGDRWFQKGGWAGCVATSSVFQNFVRR
jgi:hypothetical protein